MYLGKIVEVAPADDLYDNPLHPYTITLLSAIPIPDPVVERNAKSDPRHGRPAEPGQPADACRFHTRCPFVQPTRCADEEPLLRELDGPSRRLPLRGGDQGGPDRPPQLGRGGPRRRCQVKIPRLTFTGTAVRTASGRLFGVAGGGIVARLPSRVIGNEGAIGRPSSASREGGIGWRPAPEAGARAELAAVARPRGRDCEAQVVNDRMDQRLLGHPYAKSALDIACIDLAGRAAGLPACILLGGRRLDSYPIYAAISLGPADEMAAEVERLRGDGVHQFQLKVGTEPRADAARARCARGGRRRRRRDRRRQRRLAGTGRRRRRAPAGRVRPRLPRAAVPDARGMPLRAAADDAADGPRRGDHGRRLTPPRISGRGDGGDQPEDLQGGQA